MSSSRLPGKVLKPILGTPMLGRQIERIRTAKGIAKLVVATSMDASDDVLAAYVEEIGVDCYRGSLGNVLDRFYRAANDYKSRHVIRLTGDCPLTDPNVLDRLVDLHASGGYDYTSNVHARTYPDGLDAEIFTAQVLEEAWQRASTTYEREHVTPYMYRKGSSFRLGSLKDDIDRSSMRWTVDYPADFQFVSDVFETLYPVKRNFNMSDVLHLLEQRPEISQINAQYREGVHDC